MTVESTHASPKSSLECPYEFFVKGPTKLPDDITARLRPATSDEIAAHRQLLDSRSFMTKIADGTKDLAERASNTARIALNLDFRANMELTIYDDPYLSLHKIVGREFYISRHPVVIKEILRYYHNDDSEKSCFHIRDGDSKTIEFIREVFGDDEITYDDFLLLASKKPTKAYRKFLLQYFSSVQAKKLIPSISAFAETTIQKWHDSKEPLINVTKETKIFATSVMSKLFLGHTGPYEEICRAVDNILVYMVSMLLNKSVSKEFKQQIQIDAEVLKSSVDLAMNTTNVNPDDASLVEAMINREEFNERQVKIMTFTLFFAGQENTASALNYVIFKCAQNKELQYTVRKEIQTIIDKQGCTVGEAATQSMTIKQIITEGLRMVTPAYSIGRYANKDLVLEITHADSGVKESRYIESGTRVNPCPTFAARHETLVPDQPNTFDHERFAPEEIPAFLPNLPWSPFGGGPDTCPAWSLAYHEEMIFLGTLLHGYDIDTELIGEPNQVGRFACTLADDVKISLKKACVGGGGDDD